MRTRKKKPKSPEIGTGLWERKDTEGYGFNNLEDLQNQRAQERKRKCLRAKRNRNYQRWLEYRC